MDPRGCNRLVIQILEKGKGLEVWGGIGLKAEEDLTVGANKGAKRNALSEVVGTLGNLHRGTFQAPEKTGGLGGS